MRAAAARGRGEAVRQAIAWIYTVSLAALMVLGALLGLILLAAAPVAIPLAAALLLLRLFGVI